jgi:hypothetical protein
MYLAILDAYVPYSPTGPEIAIENKTAKLKLMESKDFPCLYLHKSDLKEHAAILLSHLAIEPLQGLSDFLHLIEGCYRDNPYHNFTHAF